MKKVIMLVSITFLILLTGCKTNIKLANYDINQNLNSKYNDQHIKASDEFHRLFTEQVKHQITIIISRSEWNKLNQDMLKYDDLKSDTYFKAKFIYSDIHGELEVDEIGFRTRGTNSRTLLQNNDGSYNPSHFKIKFNETFDYANDTKTYTILNDRKVFDLEELNLKYNSNNDLSNVSEIHANTLMNLSGVPAPLMSLAELTIIIDKEKVSYGLYKIVEPIDKEFIDKRYSKKESQGNLYKASSLELGKASLESLLDPKQIGMRDIKQNYHPTYDLKTNKKKADFNDLTQLIHSINSLEKENLMNYLNNNFEIDMFLRMLAVNTLMGNTDDYRGNADNYYLYFNSYTNKWMMIPYDLDQVLGADTSKFAIYSDLYHWRNNTILFPSKELRPLTDKILVIPQYQKQYEAYLNDLLDKNNQIFTFDRFSTTYHAYKSLYSNYQFNDSIARNYYLVRIRNIKEQLFYYQNNPTEKRGDLS